MNRDEYFDSAAQGRRPTSDFEWFATDKKGQIAFLTSAGFGIIPLLVFQSKELYFKAADFFRGLPVQCDFQQIIKDGGILSSWIEMARRGVFGYDWNCNSGQFVLGEPYRLIVSPTKPLFLEELPDWLKSWLAPIRFANVEFGDAQELFPERVFAEVNY